MDMMPMFDVPEIEEEKPSFAASLINGLKNAEREEQVLVSRSEAAKRTVMNELSENFLYKSEKGAAASVIASAMPNTWWMKQAEKESHEIIRILYSMVEERAATAKKKAEREEARARAGRLAELEAMKEKVVSSRRFFGAAKRAGVPPAPAQNQNRLERGAPEISLSAAVSPAVQAVLEKTAHYLAHPEERATPPLPMPEMKDEKYLSARTKADYKRGAAQIKRVLMEQGRKTPWDLCAYLVEVAATSSVSTYKRQRALVLRYAAAHGSAIAEQVRALPPYVEMCALLGRTPSRRSTAITEARRAAQSERIFTRLLSHLSPEYRDALLTLRFTGARSCEAESVRLERVADGIRVHIESAKTGARRKKAATSARSWVVAAGTPEAAILEGVLERRGSQSAPFSASALRAAWRRARVHEGLNTDSGWDLHSLRHQFASDEKKKTAAALRREYGEDWRRARFGKDWKSNPLYIEEYYGALAQKLGHTNAKMSKIYG